MQPAGEAGLSNGVPLQLLLNNGESTELDPQSTAIITCPKKMVGRVIGKNGETIKALQNFTGAQIQIDQRIDPTRVSIAGPPKALVTANNMVQDIVAGTFKGFAMLRAYANQNSRTNNGFDLMSQQAPVYIKGYGFVPPSQFAADPTVEGYPAAGVAGYAEAYPQALQNPFPVPAAGYQAGLPAAMMQQNPYAALQDPQQAQYMALAQAQLLSNQRGMPAQMPGAQMSAQLPQMQQMQGAPLGMQQVATSYALPSYGMGDDQAALAAQLGAMGISQSHQTPHNGATTDTSAAPTNGAASLLNQNGQQPRNPPTSGPNGRNGSSNMPNFL